jgi:hypothetical protein
VSVEPPIGRLAASAEGEAFREARVAVPALGASETAAIQFAPAVGAPGNSLEDHHISVLAEGAEEKPKALQCKCLLDPLQVPR